MMLAGPKSSYYDEYLRKQGTGRTLQDHPSSSITDRGAYVNFLEVQLERVSSACLNAQSYDQRFNDLQELLSNVEQRCGQTTRLLGLAQQCIEEIRAETDTKLVNLFREVKEEHRLMNQSYESMSTRIAVAEQTISSLCQLQPQLDVLVKRTTTNEEKIVLHLKVNDEKHRIHEERMTALSDTLNKTNTTVDKVATSLSQLTSDVNENERKANASLLKVEQRLKNAMSHEREDILRKLQEVHARIHNEIETLQKEFHQQLVGNASDTRRQFDLAMERMDSTKSTLSEEIDKKCCTVLESTMEAQQALKKRLSGQIHTLENESSELQKKHESVSVEVKKYLQHLKEGVSGLNTWREATDEGLHDLHKQIEITARTMANQDKKREDERVKYMTERTTEREGFMKQIRDVKEAQQIDQQAHTNLSKELQDMNEMQNKRVVEMTELSTLQQRLVQEQTQWGQEKQLLVGQIESMRKELDQHDHHHLRMTKELQKLRLERDEAKAAMAKDMDAIRAQQQHQEEILQRALRSLAEETEAFQKYTATAGTASANAASTTANAYSEHVPPFSHYEHSTSSEPIMTYPDGAAPPFFGSAPIPVPGSQFKYEPQQQPPYPDGAAPSSKFQELQPPSQQYHEQQQPQHGVEESKGLEDNGGEDRRWSRRPVPSSSAYGGNTAGSDYVTGDYPTSASDGDDSENLHAMDPLGMGMGVGLGQGRHIHPHEHRRRTHELGVGYEDTRNDNDRKHGVDSVHTRSRDRDDPVRDVLSKFLDIYQDDQEKMRKKLEELATEPPLSSSSSGLRFNDPNQAPLPQAPLSSTSSASASKGNKKQASSSPSERRPSNSSPPRPPWRSNRSPERAGDRGDNNRKGLYPGDLLETKNDRHIEKIRHVASSGYAQGAVGVGVNHQLLRQEEEDLVGSLFHTQGPWIQHNRSVSPHHRSGSNNDLGNHMNTNAAVPEPLFPFAPTSTPSTTYGFVSGLGRTLSSKKLSGNGGMTKKQR